jgi:hypothetical protein
MDSSDKPSAPRFFGYPKAVKGPSYPYKRSADANPVLSGLALVVVAWMFVSQVLSVSYCICADLHQSIQARVCPAFPMVKRRLRLSAQNRRFEEILGTLGCKLVALALITPTMLTSTADCDTNQQRFLLALQT